MLLVHRQSHLRISSIGAQRQGNYPSTIAAAPPCPYGSGGHTRPAAGQTMLQAGRITARGRLARGPQSLSKMRPAAAHPRATCAHQDLYLIFIFIHLFAHLSAHPWAQCGPPRPTRGPNVAISIFLDVSNQPVPNTAAIFAIPLHKSWKLLSLFQPRDTCIWLPNDSLLQRIPRRRWMKRGYYLLCCHFLLIFNVSALCAGLSYRSVAKRREIRNDWKRR